MRAKVRKDSDTFIIKSRSWLNKEFKIPDSVLCLCRNSDNNRDDSFSVGRPTVSFDNASNRTKRRKIAKLLSSHSLTEIVSATCTGVHDEGKRKLAKHIAEVVAGGHIPKLESPIIRRYTDDEALSFFVEEKFSTFQYKMMRMQSKERGADLYPNYHQILEAKKRCYPENMNIKDKSAEVPLQSLLDHTTTRILEISQSILTVTDKSLLENVELIAKWGFDGTSEQSQYKQKAKFNDSDLFITWLVPLQLQTASQEGHPIILWRNPRPSSVRFCRPIHFQFVKETKEIIKIERENIEAQISQLIPLTITNPVKITVKYRLTLTMADGKVWSALTDNSSQVCYICKATPKDMNKLDLVCNRSLDKTTLTFRISPLHCWIRCFECLLHISYRIDIKKWRVISKTDKEKVKSRKEIIQSKFRTQMGLIVDIPKQGSGTTNDGNTARRFFENPGVVSIITDIDENVIRRLDIIL